jgi:Glycosyl hydrolase family 26
MSAQNDRELGERHEVEQLARGPAPATVRRKALTGLPAAVFCAARRLTRGSRNRCRSFQRAVRRHRIGWGCAGLLALSSIGWGTSNLWTTQSLDAKTACVKPENVPGLAAFSDLVGRPVDCVLLYNDTSPGWAQWTEPWFTNTSAGVSDWSAWLKVDPAVRRVVVSQEMVPSDVPSNWRELGAAGDYDHYAHQLAVNLVAAGMGNAVIRLGHEMNGTWYHDSLGNDPSEYRDWATYWARIVETMRAVPGSHFLFDWSINAGYRDIPFGSYYPGNDVVDIIGMDIYDAGMPGNSPDEKARWASLYREPGGLMQVISFARKNNKPLSFPEWGLVSLDSGGLGDDPTYVRGIATTVKENQVVYESYFDSVVGGTMLLQNAPQSLRVWKEYFGSGGAMAGRPW